MEVRANTNPELTSPCVVEFCGVGGQRHRLGCRDRLDGEVKAITKVVPFRQTDVTVFHHDDWDVVSFRAVATWFYDHFTKGEPDSHWSARNLVFKHVVASLGDYRIRDLTVEVLRDFRTKLVAKPELGEVTTYVICRKVKAIYTTLHWAGIITSNPTHQAFSTMRKSFSRVEIRFPSAAEIEHIRSVLSATDPREAVMIDLFYEAGLRLKEASTLPWANYQPPHRGHPGALKIDLVADRNGNRIPPARPAVARTIEVSEHLANSLAVLRDDPFWGNSDFILRNGWAFNGSGGQRVDRISRGREPLQPSGLRFRVNDIIKRAELWAEDDEGEPVVGKPRYTPLELRHACAINWYQKYSILEHAQALGMSPINLLQNYEEFFVSPDDFAHVSAASARLNVKKLRPEARSQSSVSEAYPPDRQ